MNKKKEQKDRKRGKASPSQANHVPSFPCGFLLLRLQICFFSDRQPQAPAVPFFSSLEMMIVAGLNIYNFNCPCCSLHNRSLPPHNLQI